MFLGNVFARIMFFCKVEDYFLENRTEVMSKEILLLRLWRLDRSVEALRGPAEQLSHRDISAVRCQ